MEISGIMPAECKPSASPEADEINPRRITLFHKSGPALLCTLTRSIEEISYGKVIEDTFVLAMRNRDNVDVRYEPYVDFERRMINSGPNYYTLATSINPHSHKLETKILPFSKRGELVSDILKSGSSLDSRINDLLAARNKRIIEIYENIADRGLWKALHSEMIKDSKKEIREIGRDLYDQVYGMFHEEPDEPLVKRRDILAQDRNLRDYFDNAGQLGFATSLMQILFSRAPEDLGGGLNYKFRKKSSSLGNEDEKTAISLSDFMLSDPKLISGLKKSFYDFKAARDIATYTALTGLAAYAVYNWSPWIWAPIAGVTAWRSVVMARNAFKSGRQNYS